MRSQRLSALIAGACLLVAAAAAQAAEKPLNLLFFGNSFTQGGRLPVSTRIQRLATADGHATPVVVADLAGGTDLDRHIAQVANQPTRNVTNKALPEGETWDFVVIQGYSTEATHLRDVPKDGPFAQDALTLFESVANHPSGNGKGVTAVLYETWARKNLVPQSFPTLDAMQNEIQAGYQSAFDAIHSSGAKVRLGAVGEGFRKSGYDSTLYDKVGYHLTSKGYTFASLVLYRTIYKEKVSDIPYAKVASWAGVSSEADWAKLTELADATPITVPEPSSLGLLGVGGLVVLRRRRGRW